MAEHTKTPWHVDQISSLLCVIRDENGFRLADAYELANARFIVTAVNNHDKLVKALRGVNIMLNCQLQRYSEEPWAQRVKEALKEVEGQQGFSPVSMPKKYGKIRDGRIIGGTKSK